MADNITVEQATSGVDVATDEVSSRHYQIVKLALGADGTATMIALGQTTMAASIPVTFASDQTPPVVSKTTNTNVTTLTGVSTSTPVDLDVSDCDEVGIYWNITANSGSWKLVIQAYTPDELAEVDICESAAQTSTGTVMITIPVKTINKLKLSHVRTSGTITSTTQCIKR